MANESRYQVGDARRRFEQIEADTKAARRVELVHAAAWSVFIIFACVAIYFG